MMSILSEDLVEEILSRVPATSLKRLRFTCKQWNALFSNHRFTKKHFDKAPKELLVLMLKNLRVYSMSVNLKGIQNNIDPSIEVKGKLGLPDCHNYKIFHCNGLLLCTRLTMRGGRSLMVCNPCMEQTRCIDLRTVYKALDAFALGYQNNKSCCGSYKILRLCCNEYSRVVVEVEIYEFNSKSWRVLDKSWRVLDDVTHDWKLARHVRGVSLKGNTYWIASDKNKVVDKFLINFDFTKERFQRSPLPFEYHYFDTVMLSTVREEKLAVLFQNRAESKMEIWLTNKIDEPNDVSWRLLFRVDLDYKYTFAFSMSFIVDEETKLALCCDTIMDEEDRPIIFIVGEDIFRQVKLLGEFALRPNWWKPKPFLFGYVPSLIQI